MSNNLTMPKADGFYMPAEYSPQQGCIMIWPERPGSWPYGAKAARAAFTQIIETLNESEQVWVAVSENGMESAKAALGHLKNVTIYQIDTDDAWARDTAPTFLVNGAGERRCVSWRFNAWGGDYNGLYAHWERDDAFAGAIAERLEAEVYEASPFVLEGGSIHADGEGTVLVTEACLLSKGRNPDLTKEEIEDKLKNYLGAEKIIWLPRGIYNDETDEHVDNVCAFIRPAEVVLAWTDKEDDPQYPLSMASLKVLESETDAKGRPFIVHKLPIPDHPICVTPADLEGYDFEEGEDVREVGERLAASYVNFYFSNGHVILPAFGGENEESDRRAAKILAELCPERAVAPIPARDILVGGGNIHCITQQVPMKTGEETTHA